MNEPKINAEKFSLESLSRPLYVSRKEKKSISLQIAAIIVKLGKKKKSYHMKPQTFQSGTLLSVVYK